MYAADLRAVENARSRIATFVHATPVFTCQTLDRRAGRLLFLKAESLQRGGAFKARGAHNAALRLPRRVRERGLVTHSSGNHAQAVALAARSLGVPAHVVMPIDAPAVKRAAVEGYGAIVHPCEPTLEARARGAEAVLRATGGSFIPPYDHPDVIAGQGTVALELAEQVQPLDAVVAPIGGGGLVSGIALALQERAPRVRVFAAEPEGADDAARSKATGVRVTSHVPRTCADGLLTTLGELTWPVVRDLVEEVLVVDEDAIARAMRLLWERAKLVVEPSAAVPLAAVLAPAFRARPGLRRVAVVLSGGNVDVTIAARLYSQGGGGSAPAP